MLITPVRPAFYSLTDKLQILLGQNEALTKFVLLIVGARKANNFVANDPVHRLVSVNDGSFSVSVDRTASFDCPWVNRCSGNKANQHSNHHD